MYILVGKFFIDLFTIINLSVEKRVLKIDIITLNFYTNCTYIRNPTLGRFYFPI